MHDPKIIIAIDGYSSCGKSTLARDLSQALHYTHIDSGAMYRAVTLWLLQNGIDITDHSAVAQALEHISISRSTDHDHPEGITWLNGANVESLIRSPFVSDKVSEVSTIRQVRVFLVEQQKKMGLQKGIVMEGRDIGTVVFPQAELKLFLTADMDIRIDRRYRELQAKGVADITREAVRENIEHRDYTDTHRAESPLIKADDAILLDNSILSRQDQLRIALRMAHNVIEGLRSR